MSDYPRMSNCSGEATGAVSSGKATDTVTTVELLLVTIFAFVTAVIVAFDRLVRARAQARASARAPLSPLGEDRSQ